jgi:hypothetical protein
MSFSEPLTGRASFGGFVVQELCVARRAAPFSHDPHAQRVADLYLLRRFCATSIDLDFPTGDRGRRQRARFEEAGRPHPAIEPYG